MWVDTRSLSDRCLVYEHNRGEYPQDRQRNHRDTCKLVDDSRLHTVHSGRKCFRARMDSGRRAHFVDWVCRWHSVDSQSCRSDIRLVLDIRVRHRQSRCSCPEDNCTRIHQSCWCTVHFDGKLVEHSDRFSCIPPVDRLRILPCIDIWSSVVSQHRKHSVHKVVHSACTG